MITTFHEEDIVYQRLNTSALKTAITGIIKKGKRPLNSTKEDVVINTLPISALQLQEGIVNVNIYVPNLVITVGGVQDFTQPDSARLKELTTTAIDLLTDQWPESGDINYTVQQQTLFEDEESKSHYVNIRLQFYAINV
ncbi:hypothetical protein [Chitinophaga japonensis]|uniref:Uncharacterized protein n=1 Tax=Chitinophaga japonensis TaxID=104662 RepID=A0A562SZ11_CHIJA|nr:hypothetical protein [Chitinophaga japonensis]TWI86298.1 hypothetical protein LX66_3552 [Chitinophaga japonensis]